MESVHNPFKKACGASSCVYNAENHSLVLLVSIYYIFMIKVRPGWCASGFLFVIDLRLRNVLVQSLLCCWIILKTAVVNYRHCTYVYIYLYLDNHLTISFVSFPLLIQSRNDQCLKLAHMLSDMHFRNLKQKIVLMYRTEEAAKQLESTKLQSIAGWVVLSLFLFISLVWQWAMNLCNRTKTWAEVYCCWSSDDYMKLEFISYVVN